MKNVLISTGGTGGHVIPALNINDHLSNIFNTYIVTDLRGIKFIDKNKYKFEVIETPKFPSSLTKYPIYFFLIINSLVKSFLYLKKKKIHYLISTGGYMSIPLCISAKILGINIYLFEPNKVLGKSNKLILKFCKKIICNYENIINFPSKFDDKIFLIKPILKKEIFLINKNKKTPNNGLNILVLGGSQGANFFDQFVENLILNISKKFKITVYQQVNNSNILDKLKKKYLDNNIQSNIFTFDNDILNSMSKCNIAITRCGASTIAELVYLNIPFIGIPFPFAKDNHQFYNAKFYEEKDCCWLYNQKDISLDKMLDLFNSIIENPKIYSKKYENLSKFSYEYNWNNVNKKLIDLLDEN